MGKVISIANQKGGVGKTTTAINLAASLAAIEHPTLVIDLDPQSNTTSGIGIDAKSVINSIYEVMVGGVELRDCIRNTDMPFLDIVPAHINLVGAEIEMIERHKREHILSQAIGEARERYDFVIIDCPPSLGLLTINALTASDSVLIPVQCEYFALEGLGQLLNTIKIVRQHLNTGLQIEGVALTMYDIRTRLSSQVAEEVKRYFGDKVFNSVIARNVRLAESPSFGKPALLYDSLSTGSQNYLALAREIIIRNRDMFSHSPVFAEKSEN
jgi:chromosome partitioning protein